jgi:uncharacterized protein (DUF1697 family)
MPIQRYWNDEPPARLPTNAREVFSCCAPSSRVPRRGMPRESTMQVALLRAVNIGPHGKIAMSDLRELMTELGLQDGKTLLQSGNMVFRGGSKAGSALERQLEDETKKRFDLETDFFVRTAAEWNAVVAANPFPDEARKDPSHLVVIFLKEAIKPAAVTALQAAIAGREVARCQGKNVREVYITYPDGIGNSKVTNTLLEKKLGTSGTGRNWNTVLKLQALAGS